MAFDQAAWDAKKKAAKTKGHIAGASLINSGSVVNCPYETGTSLRCIFYSGVVTGMMQDRKGKMTCVDVETIRQMRKLSQNLWAAWKKKKGIKEE